MLVIELERELRASPEEAFALICEPELMNRWSEARVERVATGDGGHPGATGALRRVHAKVAGRDTRLDEVIERAEPARELRYRVYAPDTVRHHLGVQTIEPTAKGARLRWRVEIELVARPLEWAAGAALRPALGRSLDAMERVAAEGVPARALPPRRDLLREREEAAELRPVAEACLAAQRRRAKELLERGDDRGWFAQVYQRVTEEQLRASGEEGRFEHPAWVLRLVIAFHALWQDNLAARLGERRGEVEAHWRRAHAIAERGGDDGATALSRALRSIEAGMRAHVEDDLPRAIARVHRDAYAGRADVARFRGDYLRMSDLFVHAADAVRTALPESEWPARARLADALTPEWMKARAIDRRFYPLREKRMQAFERAIGLVRVLGA